MSNSLGLASQIIVHITIFILSLNSANAQTNDDDSHWGIQGSVGPQWYVPAQLGDLLFHGAELDVTGREFIIGFVRGKAYGNDAGISFLYRNVSDATVTSLGESCLIQSSNGVQDTSHCVPSGSISSLSRATMAGVEAHKFISFTTIGNRLQIGLNVAGGVGRIDGSAEQRLLVSQFVPGGNEIRSVEETRTIPAAEALGGLSESGVTALGRLEVMAAVITAPGVKLKFSGGLSYPGVTRLTIGMTYLFGVRGEPRGNQ